MKARQNKEGMTLREWVIAAGYMPTLCTIELYKAWMNGEDPTDYRKEKEQIKSPIIYDYFPLITYCDCPLDAGYNPLAYMCPNHRSY